MVKTFKMFLISLILISNCLAEEITAENYKFGYCPITGNQIIDVTGRPLPNYRIVWFELSNGSRMPLAIDEEAIGLITEADFERIMSWVRAGWQWEINQKKWTPQQIQDYKDTYFGLTIIKIVE